MKHQTLEDLTQFVAAVSKHNPTLLLSIAAHFDRREDERRRAARLGCSERRTPVKRTLTD